jgi:hypothetical protein
LVLAEAEAASAFFRKARTGGQPTTCALHSRETMLCELLKGNF